MKKDRRWMKSIIAASTEAQVRDARNSKRAILSQVKVERHELEEDLGEIASYPGRAAFYNLRG